jgi:hypothetical protein
LTATLDSGEAKVVRGRVAHLPAGQVGACIVLGDAVRQNGEPAAEGHEFELFLDCRGAPHLSVKVRLVSEIGLEKLPFRDPRLLGLVGPDRRRHTEPRCESHHQARAAACGLVHAPGGIRSRTEQAGRFVLQLPPGGGEPDALKVSIPRSTSSSQVTARPRETA